MSRLTEDMIASRSEDVVADSASLRSLSKAEEVGKNCFIEAACLDA